MRTPHNEGAPELSPDGRWLAYASDESGKGEIYVRPFPPSGSGGKWQVSAGGGEYPVWSRTGDELFFRDSKGGILLAGYKVNGDSFVAEKPRAWTARSFYAIGFTRGFDLAPDGRRFAVLIDELGGDRGTERKATSQERPAAQLTILLNFFDEVRRRERAAGRQAR